MTQYKLNKAEEVQVTITESVSDYVYDTVPGLIEDGITKDVFFEETYDPNLKPEGTSDSSEGTDDENTQGGGSGDNTTGDNTQGGDNQQGGGNSSITPGEGD